MTQAPPAYPAPGRPLPPPPHTPSNGLGLAGFIVSIVGVVLCLGFICPIGAILSGIALIWKPRGFAIAGLVLGVLGTILWALVWWLVLSSTSSLFPYGGQYWMAKQAIDDHHYFNNNTLPDDATGAQLVGTYSDAWGTPFDYRYVDPQTYEILSAGPDTQFGTNDDVVNTETPSASYGSFGSSSTNRPADEAIADAHAVIERTFENDYQSPAWHEVEQLLGSRFTDEWGTAIQYNAGEGKAYELRSAGPDRTFGTADDIVQAFELGGRGHGGSNGQGGPADPPGTGPGTDTTPAAGN